MTDKKDQAQGQLQPRKRPSNDSTPSDSSVHRRKKEIEDLKKTPPSILGQIDAQRAYIVIVCEHENVRPPADISSLDEKYILQFIQKNPRLQRSVLHYFIQNIHQETEEFVTRTGVGNARDVPWNISQFGVVCEATDGRMDTGQNYPEYERYPKDAGSEISNSALDLVLDALDKEFFNRDEKFSDVDFVHEKKVAQFVAKPYQRFGRFPYVDKKIFETEDVLADLKDKTNFQQIVGLGFLLLRICGVPQSETDRKKQKGAFEMMMIRATFVSYMAQNQETLMKGYADQVKEEMELHTNSLMAGFLLFSTGCTLSRDQVTMLCHENLREELLAELGNDANQEVAATHAGTTPTSEPMDRPENGFDLFQNAEANFETLDNLGVWTSPEKANSFGKAVRLDTSLVPNNYALKCPDQPTLMFASHDFSRLPKKRKKKEPNTQESPEAKVDTPRKESGKAGKVKLQAGKEETKEGEKLSQEHDNKLQNQKQNSRSGKSRFVKDALVASKTVMYEGSTHANNNAPLFEGTKSLHQTSMKSYAAKVESGPTQSSQSKEKPSVSQSEENGADDSDTLKLESSEASEASANANANTEVQTVTVQNENIVRKTAGDKNQDQEMKENGTSKGGKVDGAEVEVQAVNSSSGGDVEMQDMGKPQGAELGETQAKPEAKIEQVTRIDEQVETQQQTTQGNSNATEKSLKTALGESIARTSGFTASNKRLNKKSKKKFQFQSPQTKPMQFVAKKEPRPMNYLDKKNE